MNNNEHNSPIEKSQEININDYNEYIKNEITAIESKVKEAVAAKHQHLNEQRTAAQKRIEESQAAQSQLLNTINILKANIQALEEKINHGPDPDYIKRHAEICQDAFTKENTDMEGRFAQLESNITKNYKAEADKLNKQLQELTLAQTQLITKMRNDYLNFEHTRKKIEHDAEAKLKSEIDLLENQHQQKLEIVNLKALFDQKNAALLDSRFDKEEIVKIENSHTEDRNHLIAQFKENESKVDSDIREQEDVELQKQLIDFNIGLIASSISSDPKSRLLETSKKVWEQRDQEERKALKAQQQSKLTTMHDEYKADLDTQKWYKTAFNYTLNKVKLQKEDNTSHRLAVVKFHYDKAKKATTDEAKVATLESEYQRIKTKLETGSAVASKNAYLDFLTQKQQEEEKNLHASFKQQEEILKRRTERSLIIYNDLVETLKKTEGFHALSKLEDSFTLDSAQLNEEKTLFENQFSQKKNSIVAALTQLEKVKLPLDKTDTDKLDPNLKAYFIEAKTIFDTQQKDKGKKKNSFSIKVLRTSVMSQLDKEYSAFQNDWKNRLAELEKTHIQKKEIAQQALTPELEAIRLGKQEDMVYRIEEQLSKSKKELLSKDLMQALQMLDDLKNHKLTELNQEYIKKTGNSTAIDELNNLKTSLNNKELELQGTIDQRKAESKAATAKQQQALSNIYRQQTKENEELVANNTRKIDEVKSAQNQASQQFDKEKLDLDEQYNKQKAELKAAYEEKLNQSKKNPEQCKAELIAFLQFDLNNLKNNLQEHHDALQQLINEENNIKNQTLNRTTSTEQIAQVEKEARSTQLQTLLETIAQNNAVRAEEMLTFWIDDVESCIENKRAFEAIKNILTNIQSKDKKYDYSTALNDVDMIESLLVDVQSRFSDKVKTFGKVLVALGIGMVLGALVTFVLANTLPLSVIIEAVTGTLVATIGAYFAKSEIRLFKPSTSVTEYFKGPLLAFCTQLTNFVTLKNHIEKVENGESISIEPAKFVANKDIIESPVIEDEECELEAGLCCPS